MKLLSQDPPEYDVSDEIQAAWDAAKDLETAQQLQQLDPWLAMQTRGCVEVPIGRRGRR